MMSHLAQTKSVDLNSSPQKTFTKKFRLRKRGQFLYVQHKGVRVQATSCFAYITYHKRPYIRLGITVSKKVGKAHQRNRIKRLMREAFRHSTLRNAQGLDIVVIAKKENPPQSLKNLVETFDQFYTHAMKYKMKQQPSHHSSRSHKSSTKTYKTRRQNTKV